MQASRACGAEVSSCTRTPPGSPTQENTKIRKALLFALESTVPPFLVRPPASFSQVAVPATQLRLKIPGPRLDQGA
jgi:hypothetical protein